MREKTALTIIAGYVTWATFTRFRGAITRRPKLGLPMELPRFTVGRAMIAIAGLALLMGLARQNLFLAIFFGCVTCATLARSHEAVTRRLRSCQPVTREQTARVVVSSLLVSTIIIGLSDLVFLIAYSLYKQVRTSPHDRSISEEGVFFGILMALFFSGWVRRSLWPCEIGRPRRIEQKDAPTLDVAALLESASSARTGFASKAWYKCRKFGALEGVG